MKRYRLAVIVLTLLGCATAVPVAANAYRFSIVENGRMRAIHITKVERAVSFQVNRPAAPDLSIVTATHFRSLPSPTRSLTVVLTPGEATRLWLPGRRAPNLKVTSVTINGRRPQLAQAATSTEYGFDVVIRFFQTGHRFYMRAASASPARARIAIDYMIEN